MDRVSSTLSRDGMPRVHSLGGRERVRVRDWEVWALPGRLRAFVLGVICADVALIAACAVTFRPHASNLELFGLLLACSAATVELTRRASEPAGVIKDVCFVWELPAIILLPPLYAVLMPSVRIALTQWRVRKAPPHRRVFTVATLGLAYGCASGLYRAILPGAASRDYLLGHAPMWLLAAVVCAITQWAVNQVLIMTAVKATEPDTRIRTAIFGREAVHNDVTELCTAVLATLGLTMSTWTLIVALPLATILQRAFRHDQLLHEARKDSKTGLLNAAAWERKAEAEVERAVRTSSALAVALLDLDKFKAINDTHGHLLGDEVLRSIAGIIRDVLRDYDLAGRFGGEEFVVLLPQTRAVDALRIAERLRAHISRLAVYADGPSGRERVPVTVSIGVAALDAGTRRELTELLAAADAALYRAKATGRDQVQMISTSRGLSAVRPPAAAGRRESDRPAESDRSADGGLFAARSSLPGEHPFGAGLPEPQPFEAGQSFDAGEAEPELEPSERAALLAEGAPVLPAVHAPDLADDQLPDDEGSSTTATTSAVAV
jgi:diguanylate cyclase (GGDEF)-like protein